MSGRRMIAGIAGIVVVLVLFSAYEMWVSAAEQIRSQRELLSALKMQLDAGAEGGEAAPAKIGEPIGLLEAPSVGIEQVVLEGTGPRRLKAGPGHDPSTPLPGAAGTSVIEGRHQTYGAPFRRIADLEAEDEIILTTSRGRSRFRVIESGTPEKEAELHLLTTVSLGAEPLVVRAALEGRPLLGGAAPARRATQEPSPVVWLSLNAFLLGAASVATWKAYRTFHPRVTFVLSSPVLLALLLITFGTADRLLPGSI